MFFVLLGLKMAFSVIQYVPTSTPTIDTFCHFIILCDCILKFLTQLNNMCIVSIDVKRNTQQMECETASQVY
jgi:hypothetical protein